MNDYRYTHPAIQLYSILSEIYSDYIIYRGKISDAPACKLDALITYYNSLQEKCILHPGIFSYTTFRMLLLTAELINVNLKTYGNYLNQKKGILLESILDLLHMEKEYHVVPVASATTSAQKPIPFPLIPC